MTDNREFCYNCGEEFAHLSSQRHPESSYCRREECTEIMQDIRDKEDAKKLRLLGLDQKGQIIYEGDTIVFGNLVGRSSISLRTGKATKYTRDKRQGLISIVTDSGISSKSPSNVLVISYVGDGA